ncbi:MAG: hypothetical protein U0835_23905 [Isosphaeraceae bacterium]
MAGGRFLTVHATAAGGLIGLLLGFGFGAYVGCERLWPESNLCGLIAVFGTGPVGVALGALAGQYVVRPAGGV